ncbi:MAG: hypothetical protein IJQ35_03665 [Bacteroidales bacterium]|nr:hypothetical protein [Bacteroidales bacterium]
MKLNREILRLAVPSILANITVPLVGMVDIAVVGHLGAGGGISGAAFIGGISVGTMLFDLLYWNFGFLRTGTGGLTAQAYGRLKAGLPVRSLSVASPRTLPSSGTPNALGEAFSGAPGANSASNAPGEAFSGAPGANSALNAPGEAFPGAPGANSALNAPGEAFPGAPGAKSTRFAPEIASILGRAMRIAMLSGLALIVLQWVVVQLAFLVVQCSPEVRTLATRYFYIRIWAAPATLSLFALKGWFIGLQDSLRPMLIDLWVNGVNMLLSVLLSFGLVLPAGGLLPTLGPGLVAAAGGILPTLGPSPVAAAGVAGGGHTLIPALGFAGVAWGTVIAQWTGLLLALLVARKYLSLNHLLRILCSFCAEDCTEYTDNQKVTSHPSAGVSAKDSATAGHRPSFFTLNRDLFLRSVGMIAVYIGFTVLSARLGDLMLAVSTILMKLLMIFSYFTDGFAYAGEALTGRFLGERSPDGVRSTVRGTFCWGFGLAAVFMLLYGLGSTPLFRLMTSDLAVVQAGRQFIPWLLLMPLIGCPAFTWDGVFIGATASKDLRNSTLLCAVGFFAVWLGGQWWASGSLGIGSMQPETGLHILMAAYFMHLAIRAVYLTLRYKPAVLRPLI